MKSWTLALFLACAPTLALATAPAEHDQSTKVVEERQAEIYHTLEEKKSAGLATLLGGQLTLSGLLEVEGGFQKTSLRSGGSEKASDLTLATAQLGFGVTASENIGGTLTLLYEEADDARIEVDEATIDLNNGPWRARVGRQYLPFGVFRSHFISDPLTLELGETQATALRAGYHQKLFALDAFAFKGDAEQAGKDDQIRDVGASLTLTPAEGMELAASYLSDLGDSGSELLGATYTRRVAGWSASAVAALGPVELSGEYLGAVKSFAAADLDADLNGSGDQPRAWNLEVAVYPVETVEIAARFEGSDQFAGQPRRQYGLVTNWGFHANASLALQYLRGEFDEPFGVGQDARDLATIQLALAF